MHPLNDTNCTCRCAYDFGESFSTNRLVIVAIMMTSVCVVGFFGNLLIVVVLSQKRMRSPSNWFLVVLAVFDTSLMAVSILLYVVETIYDFIQNYDMYAAWSQYVESMYGFSHFVQVMTVYLTLAATIERFISLWSYRLSRSICMGSMPFLWMIMVLFFSALCTGSRFFELKVIHNESCSGDFGEFTLDAAPLLYSPLYNEIYTIYLQNILFVFLPFVLLAVLNTLIYLKMRQQTVLEHQSAIMAQMNGTVTSTVTHGRSLSQRRARKGKKNREATVILLIVVVVFLICNFPGFALTVIEQIMGDMLKARLEEFYATTRDVINLLAVINSSANFAIYLTLGSEFRKEVGILFRSFCRIVHCKRFVSRVSSSKSFDTASYSSADQIKESMRADAAEDEYEDLDPKSPWQLRSCESLEFADEDGTMMTQISKPVWTKARASFDSQAINGLLLPNGQQTYI